MQQKRYAEAEAELSRALQINEASSAAHLFRGRALIELSRYAEAEKELLRALALGGDDGARMAHRYLGAIYIEQGETARAIASLETYLRLDPKAGDTVQIQGIIKQLRAQITRPKKMIHPFTGYDQ